MLKKQIEQNANSWSSLVHPEMPKLRAPPPPKHTDTLCKTPFELLKLLSKLKGKALDTKTHSTKELGHNTRLYNWTQDHKLARRYELILLARK